AAWHRLSCACRGGSPARGIDRRARGDWSRLIQGVSDMAILQSLRRLLDDHHVSYEVHAHRQTFTARDTAAADHIPPSEMAKVLVLRGRDQLLMAVLPASHMLDLYRLQKTVGDPQLRLAAERELVDACPACEPGAVPPFGQLFGMPVWVDDSLGRERETV